MAIAEKTEGIYLKTKEVVMGQAVQVRPMTLGKEGAV
jgi:hypothetical protein